jgi:hypothetical protein
MRPNPGYNQQDDICQRDQQRNLQHARRGRAIARAGMDMHIFSLVSVPFPHNHGTSSAVMLQSCRLGLRNKEY